MALCRRPSGRFGRCRSGSRLAGGEFNFGRYEGLLRKAQDSLSEATEELNKLGETDSKRARKLNQMIHDLAKEIEGPHWR